MSEWVAAQPAESSAAAWAAVDELAHAYVADGEHRSLDQARADAMIDLILGQATITTTVELNLPPSALPAPGGLLLRRRRAKAKTLGGLPGAGVFFFFKKKKKKIFFDRNGPPAAGRDRGGPGRADPHPGPDRAADRPRHPVPDRAARPGHGALLAVDARVYRPHEATARLVRRRDGTCRFPGCATPAARADLDHVTTFATGGDTDPPT